MPLLLQVPMLRAEVKEGGFDQRRLEDCLVGGDKTGLN
jgi:hypothetical protein